MSNERIIPQNNASQSNLSHEHEPLPNMTRLNIHQLNCTHHNLPQFNAPRNNMTQTTAPLPNMHEPNTTMPTGSPANGTTPNLSQANTSQCHEQNIPQSHQPQANQNAQQETGNRHFDGGLTMRQMMTVRRLCRLIVNRYMRGSLSYPYEQISTIVVMASHVFPDISVKIPNTYDLYNFFRRNGALHNDHFPITEDIAKEMVFIDRFLMHVQNQRNLRNNVQQAGHSYGSSDVLQNLRQSLRETVTNLEKMIESIVASGHHGRNAEEMQTAGNDEEPLSRSMEANTGTSFQRKSGNEQIKKSDNPISITFNGCFSRNIECTECNRNDSS